MDELRSFIKMDNHSAVDVGRLRRCTRPFFYVQKPNFSVDYPEAVIREGADEIALRAEEVKTLKACIIVDHLEENRWDRRWLMRTGMSSAKQFTKELEGVNGKSCTFTTEMSKAAGAKKKPRESQKSKSHLVHEGSQGQEGRNSMIQLAKKTCWEGSRQDRSCGKSASETQS